MGHWEWTLRFRTGSFSSEISLFSDAQWCQKFLPEALSDMELFHHVSHSIEDATSRAMVNIWFQWSAGTSGYLRPKQALLQTKTELTVERAGEKISSHRYSLFSIVWLDYLKSPAWIAFKSFFLKQNCYHLFFTEFLHIIKAQPFGL